MKNLKKKFTVVLIIFTFVISLGTISGSNDNLAVVYANQTVYITKTGSKYHSHKCGNGTYYSSTLSEAKSMGLEPCKKCFPNGAPTSSDTGSSKTTSKSVPSLKLNTTSKVLIVGQTCKLKASGVKQKITWKSNKASVASVNQKGKVKAKKKGKAVITATVGSKKKTCKIKVEDPEISQTQLIMMEGEEEVLEMEGCSHEVEWDSSDYDVVDVCDGELTALTPGSVVITAYVHGKEYQCMVTVQEEVDLEE